MALLGRSLLAAALAAGAGGACAHIVADPDQGPAGTYQAVRLRVGHGCGEAATTALRVELPETLALARPQPKPGWRLEIETAPGAGEVPPRVAAVTWRGELPAGQFDEFALLLKLPAEPTTLYLPTVQTCGADEAQWTELPDPGESAHDLSRPAPSLRVLPAPADGDSHHH